MFENALSRITTILAIASLAVVNYKTFGQINKQWETRYAETGFTDDAAEDIITDIDGNSFVLGHSGFDALLLKYDNKGKLTWSFQTGRGVFIDYGYSPTRDFKLDSQGNIYLLLYGNVIGESPYIKKICLIKIDPNGKQLWQQTINADDGKIKLAVDSNDAAFAFYNSDQTHAALSKFTSSGVLSWTKSFNTGEPFVQDINIINDKVIAWHYSGYQTSSRKSFLHVYDLDGALVWENEYKYNSSGTYISNLCYHSNELFMAYYIDNGSRQFTQVIKYNMSNGDSLQSFAIQMNLFQNDDPLACMYVGDDSQIYVMGEDQFIVKKYSSDGALAWTYKYSPSYDLKYKAMDFVVHKETSVVDILLQATDFNGGVSYTVTSFKPDQTFKVLANVKSNKATNIQPVALVESETNIYTAGSFSNGELYKNDVLISKFTSSNALIWDASFNATNSLQDAPTCVTGDTQGNIYVGGLLWLTPDQNVFGIIKYDNNGKQLWVKKVAPDNLTGYTTARTMVTAIAVNNDNEVFVTGVIRVEQQTNTSAMDAPVEMYTIKLDSYGNTVWTSKTSGKTDDFLTGFQIVIDQDKNVYVLGTNYNSEDKFRSTMILVKYDNNGNSQWEKRFSLFNGYNGLSTTNNDTDLPKMKLINNEIYVLNKGAVMIDNWTFKNALELRKFDIEGNETMLLQNSYSDKYLFPRDFCFSSSGNIYVLYNQNISDGWSFDNFETRLVALSSVGQQLWEKIWTHDDSNSYPQSGAVALDQLDQLYTITASKTEFSCSKISVDGNVLWNKIEEMKGYDSNYGRPVFVFTKTDGNPVFLSTNKNEINSNYYFIKERQKDTGEIVNSTTFDEVYDSFGDIPWNRPGDQLNAIFKNNNSDDFFITGVIEDKARASETIVTIKYALGTVNNGGGDDGGGSDGSDDGNGSGEDGSGNGDGDGEVTGIETNHVQLIQTYPTVTRGIFRIEGVTGETTSIMLTDSFGRFVCALNPQSESFDISGVSPGLYLVRVQHKNTWYTTKLIKE